MTLEEAAPRLHEEVDLATYHRVQQFLFHEALLLDERRLDEWLQLFEPDAEYWVPMSWRQPDPYNHISLFFETVDILRMRVQRLKHKATVSQRPPSRTCHVIGSVAIVGSTTAELTVRSALSLAEYRRDEQRTFSGYAHHILKLRGASFGILRKRVDIINCDADSGHSRISVPL